MIRLYSTHSVRETFRNYIKKDEYKNCKRDLCNFFKSKTIEDIFSKPILLFPNPGFNFIKSRIENSSFNKGKSGGYRLYYYVDRQKSFVYLVGFFAKTGKYGRDDLTDHELKLLIQSFGREKADHNLIEHSLRDFAEITHQ